uniref:IS110 family transposase n=1 Tax=Flavobacterium cellulosilyticum TaxID=2541731 RepID=A0A4R5C1C7_9FLAO
MSIEKIIKNCAGIDIGSEKVFVAVEAEEVRSFRTFTRSYRELGVYLQNHSITHVAMEATGVYWITLYDILEEMGFDVTLVNPADSKNLPGRKSDVQDCQWIQELFSYGLLRKSFVPDDIVRKLRVYTRMREDKLQMASSHILHMHKALVQMNIRLKDVLSQTHGASGMKMIEAILEGERDPQVLLSYCTKTEKILIQFKDKTNNDYQDDNRIKPIRHNKPDIQNLHNLLMGIHGANPTVLPGLTDYSLMRLTAELGNNIEQWPNVKAFVSWLGLAPGKHQSGKMNKRSKKKAVTRSGQIFKQAAQSLLVSKQPGLGAFARKLKARRGAAIAIKATARKIAELYYKTFDNGMQYVEKGVEIYLQQQKDQQIRFLTKKAKDLNMQLIIKS